MIKMRLYWLLVFSLLVLTTTGASVYLITPQLDAIVLSILITFLLAFLFYGFFRPVAKVQFKTAIAELNDQSGKEIKHITLHDQLTGLPNRLYFNEELKAQLKQGVRSLTLLLLDIQDFKGFNELLSLPIGDLLLKEVAKRLKDTAPHCFLARLSGNEFGLILTPSTNEETKALTQGITEAFMQPVNVQAHQLNIRFYMGAVRYPSDADNSTLLTQYATITMQAAKEHPAQTTQFYRKELSDNYLLKTSISHALKQALRNDEFYLLYQPQINLKDHSLVGVETLIRWHHPEFGHLSPEIFIPIAEEQGLIDAIGDWTIKTTIEQTASWVNASLLNSVSLNVSVWQLLHENFIEQLQEFLKLNHFPANKLYLEITETSLITNLKQVKTTLEKLAKLGIQLALDDFGKGYSSLARLRELPVHTLKIDGGFVRELNQKESSQFLIKMVLTLAKQLKLSALAEGIENETQLTILKQLGCQYGQGYYFHKPLTKDSLSQLIDNK